MHELHSRHRQISGSNFGDCEPVGEGDDAAFIAKALGTIARAKGMTQLANETGLGRESLYKALSGEGNPSFATILKVMTALGIKLHAEKAHVA